MSNIAIVLGAGNGTRMKMEKSKLLLDIMGKPVILRSVQAFLDNSDIDEVIVTVREQDLDVFSELINDDRVSFVIGGDTRQQSVKNAVDTIDECDMIAIHDGARPFVTDDEIGDTIRAAKEFGAAAIGVPVKDTIKVVDKDGVVVDTPDRSTLFAVQTPQIFSFELYKKALEKSVQDNMDFTDDCQLVEYVGGKVKMVVGSYENIKITTPDDVALGENILQQRMRG